MSRETPTPFSDAGPATRKKPHDPFALFGWVLAWVSIATCGCLAPLAMILSLIGMRNPRSRTIAVFAFVIALVQVLAVTAVTVFLYATGSFLAQEIERALQNEKTLATIAEAQAIVDARTREQEALPDESEGTAAIGSLQDSWGSPLRYELDAAKAGTYSVRSAGADSQFDTDDDLVESEITCAPSSFAETMLCLSANDIGRKRAALTWALEASPGPRRPELIDAVIPLLDDTPSLRTPARRVLARWIDKDNDAYLTGYADGGGPQIGSVDALAILVEQGNSDAVLGFLNHAEPNVRAKADEAVEELGIDASRVARQCIADLWRDKHHRAALDRLSDAEIDESLKPLLLDALIGMLENDQALQSTEEKAMEMLGRFELSDQRDQAILRLSSRSDLVGNWAIHLLVRRQYAPALVQLGKMLADPERAREAVDLLATAGPVAESYVWPSLKEESLFTRRRACQVLERIGTAQSLPHLEPLAEDPLVGEDAKKAIEAIVDANRDPVSLKSDTEKSDAENANAPDPPRKAEEDTK